jgi:VanZ family protein
MPNQKLRLKRILFLVLALATMAVIFFFSSQTGEKSGTVSSDVSTWIESSPNNVPSTGTSGDVSPWAGGFNLFSTETLNFISDHIRKIAHVFLYACLALFVTLFFSTFALPHKWLYILLPVGVCFL